MKEEFDKLIDDFLSGSIAKEDLHKLNEWVCSDPENQKYFEQQKRIWLLSAEYEMYLYMKNEPITDLRNESVNIRLSRQER